MEDCVLLAGSTGKAGDEEAQRREETIAEGKADFAEVLEYPCEFHNTGGEYSGIVCIVDVGDAEQDEVWEPRLEKAKAFFEAAAGYCSVDEYSLWFVEN